MKASALLISLCVGSSTLPALASFHLMQVEQITLALDGDTSVQAVQLRMRSAFQNQMQFGRLIVRDAAGLNPIVIHDFATSVPVNTSGSRILVASDNFLTSTVPPAVRNYPMTNLVPASYINAGKLTFEQDNGTILWSIAWGGAGYTGTNLGSTTNDADGNFGAAISGTFPTAGTSALRFNGTATAMSTTNQAQYTTVTSNVTFVNNAGASFVLTLPPEDPCFADYNADGGVDGADVEGFFADWSQGLAEADTNLDGGVDGSDVETFFAQWSAGGC
jgi:hypothetical protein